MASPPIHIWWTIVQGGEIGGDHFIALCTGLNIAFLGWKDFRDRIRFTERQLEAKMVHYSASVAESSAVHFRKLTGGFQRKIAFLRDWGWICYYGMAIVCASAGMLMLYFGCQTKSAWILLLPTLLQIGIPLGTLVLFVAWLKFVRKGMYVFSPQDAAVAVQQFSKKTKAKLDKDDKLGSA